MIAVYCDEMNSRVLVDMGSVSRVSGDGGSIDLVYRCACGRRGRLLTGRDRLPWGSSGHVD
jgi:hypothetical protein